MDVGSRVVHASIVAHGGNREYDIAVVTPRANLVALDDRQPVALRYRRLVLSIQYEPAATGLSRS